MYYFKVVSPPLSSKYFGPADFEVVVAVVGVNTYPFLFNFGKLFELWGLNFKGNRKSRSVYILLLERPAE